MNSQRESLAIRFGRLLPKSISLVNALTIGLILGVIRSCVHIININPSRLCVEYLHLSYIPLLIGASVALFLSLSIIYNLTSRIVTRLQSPRYKHVILFSLILTGLVICLEEYLVMILYLKEYRYLGSLLRLGSWHYVTIPSYLFLLLVYSLFIRLKPSRIITVSSYVLSFMIVAGVAISWLCFFSQIQTYLALHPMNVLLISIDTMRADHLGCYGYPRKTPAMDRFSRKHLFFQTTIASSPWTLPSHMSMLTGLYPWHHGVKVAEKISNDKTMVAEILNQAGYQTTALTGGGYLSEEFNYQGFRDFLSPSSKIDQLYGHVKHWLVHNKYRPFFLFMHTYQPHCPYDPLPEYDIYSDRHYRGIVEASTFCGAELEQHKDSLNADDHRYLVDKYDGEIFMTDVFLGYLFQDLDKYNLADGTLIILTSDHGENFQDFPLFPIGHNELYDAIIKVPLIIKLPYRSKPKLFSEQIELIDLFPTILDMVNLKSVDQVDGHSLVDLINGESHIRGFSHSENLFKLKNNWHYKMLRNEQWKVIQRSEQETELYDLSRDPQETVNLGREKPSLLRQLLEKMDATIIDTQEKSELQQNKKVEDEDVLDELEALGYID